MHHITTFIFAVATFSAAVTSSVFWLKSSRVTANTADYITASLSDVPELHIGAAQVNIAGIQEAMRKSCILNKWAAMWTAISALLSAVTTICGVCL